MLFSRVIKAFKANLFCQESGDCSQILSFSSIHHTEPCHQRDLFCRMWMTRTFLQRKGSLVHESQENDSMAISRSREYCYRKFWQFPCYVGIISPSFGNIIFRNGKNIFILSLTSRKYINLNPPTIHEPQYIASQSYKLLITLHPTSWSFDNIPRQ